MTVTAFAGASSEVAGAELLLVLASAAACGSPLLFSVVSADASAASDCGCSMLKLCPVLVYEFGRVTMYARLEKEIVVVSVGACKNGALSELQQLQVEAEGRKN